MIDVHENSGFNRQKKTLLGRALVVTAVTTLQHSIVPDPKNRFTSVSLLVKFATFEFA